MTQKNFIEVMAAIWREWENTYVPADGAAETVAGEIIRAFQRLEYRWFNDGDRPYKGYGNETCNSSDRYLLETVPGYVTPKGGEKTYSKSLELRQITIFEYLTTHPELFTRTNLKDSRKRLPEDRIY